MWQINYNQLQLSRPLGATWPMPRLISILRALQHSRLMSLSTMTVGVTKRGISGMGLKPRIPMHSLWILFPVFCQVYLIGKKNRSESRADTRCSKCRGMTMILGTPVLDLLTVVSLFLAYGQYPTCSGRSVHQSGRRRTSIIRRFARD